MEVNLLGLGPSLRALDLKSIDPSNLNVTFNAALFEPDLMQVSDYLVVHDSRFVDEKFLSELKHILGEKVLSFGQFENEMKKNPNIILNMTERACINKFWENLSSNELLLNVVVDFGIPVAVYLGADKINLFGCDFDYEIDHLSNPTYFGQSSNLFAFDHDYLSEKKWAERSYRRLIEAQEIFGLEGIKIKRHTVY